MLAYQGEVMAIKYKSAVCEKCGKRLEGQVPVDATNVTCFACDNPKCTCKQPHHLPVWHCAVHGEVIVQMD